MKLAHFGKRQIEQFQDDIKTQFCIPLNPQPNMDNENFWHYKDCLWKDGGLDFPETGIEDHSPYQIGDVLYIEDNGKTDSSPMTIAADDCPTSVGMPSKNTQGFIRIKGIRVCRLLDITEEEAVREGFAAGGTAVSGGPWGVEDDPEIWTATEEFLSCWDIAIPEDLRDLIGREANPWIYVYMADQISREEAVAKEEHLILHRGKRIDNGAWVYGGYFYDGKRHFIISRLGIQMSSDGAGLTGCFEVEPETVGRYVGINDKYKKRIFEGDIIEGFSPYNGDLWRCDVEFRKGAFVCRYLGDNCWQNRLHFSDFVENVQWEVVGNIHDNKTEF